jgi:hypothetical protein
MNKVTSKYIKRKKSRIALGLTLVGLLGLLWWGWVPADIDPGCKLSHNGMWVSVDWTSQPADEAAVAQLASEALQKEMDYIFPFVTYLKKDGSFSPSYDHAAEFVATFRHFNHETKVLAWIGIPLITDDHLGIEGTVDLADQATRAKVVKFAVWLVKEVQFDGVHIDAESVHSGDPNYLRLLEEIDAVIGSRMLSVAGSYWMPQALNAVLEGFKWDSKYYQEIANRVDQIVTMTYDSVMPHPALYRLWLREQVSGISSSLASSDVVLLFGVSVSKERTFTHRPSTENLMSGLAGICAGLPQVAGERGVTGVAIYAAWDADAADWDAWQRWLGDPF